MMKTKIVLSTLVLASVLFGESSAQSQSIPPSTRTPVADSSLGTQVSGANNNFTITGGLNRGQNLLHSFQDFSVPTGGAATFDNPVGNRSIITRVTGNLFSDIDGTIDTQGANFFLINPNGMVFGANTKLNVGQTFLGSTANGIDLVDAAGKTLNFGTNRNGDAELLTINPNALFNVSGLNMNGGNGQVSNFGTLQTTGVGQYIGLIGGNVNLNGGGIIALSGRVELGGLSAPGTVILGVEGNNLRAQFPNNVARGDISLINQAGVNVAGVGNGDIAITAKNLEILGGSFVSGGIIFPGFATPKAVAGDIKVNATGNIVIAGLNSIIFNQVNSNSMGQGGNITIDTSGSLVLKNGARLKASTYGKGDAGIIKITAIGDISFDNRAYIFSDVETGGVGKTGGIEIVARNVSLTNRSQLNANTYEQGDAGNIKITADNVSFDGGQNGFPSGARSIVGQGAVGKGGNIEINTQNVSVTNGAQLTSSTLGQGDAGNIKITAAGNISFDGGQGGLRSRAASTVEQGAVGKGGNIEIATRNLYVTNGAGLSASTYGQGDAGSIKITDTDNVAIDGKEDVFFSALFSQSQPGSEGKGGEIIINSRNISLTNGGSLIVNNIGINDAGNIVLNSNTIKLNKGVIGASSSNLTGGNIKITAKEYLLMRNSSIIFTDSGSSQATTNGGNIQIISPFLVTAPNENSDISANGFSGSGGKVTINTQQNFWISPLSRAELEKLLGTTDPTQLNPFNLQTNNITAISQVNPNLNGQVTTTPPEIDPSRGLSPLPNNVTDPTNQIDPNCSAKAIANNSFTNVGRGGIPATPKDPLNEQEIATNWVRLNLRLLA
jgi:filamentous hemagglutinin family protein